MATVDYPAGLPLPLRNGYALRHVSPLMRTTLATGRARQRRRYTSAPSHIAVAWNLSQQQAQIFEAWFRWSLHDGADFFQIRVLTPLGLYAYTCRFVDIYTGPELMGRDRWQFTGELELLERQTLDASYVAVPAIVTAVDIFDQAMNREWPR